MRRTLTLSVLLFALSCLNVLAQVGVPAGPVYVSEPAVPTISPAAWDLPQPGPNPNLYGLEMKRRESYGFIPTEYPITPRVDSLLELQRNAPQPAPDAFGTPLLNIEGAQSSSSPPDDTGDVGPNHFLQGINGTGSFGNSAVRIFNKSGTTLNTIELDDLASGSPCNSGYCDPIVLYDQIANRWFICEFPSSGGHLCVYVSTTPDPTGTWYAYQFMNVESGTPDYPKYGVWPQDSDNDGVYDEGSYLIGINAGASGVRDAVALDRGKMLQGLPASFQKFTVPRLPNYSFQLVLPAGHEGAAPPPNNTPAIIMRPRDDEAQDGASTPTYDLMEMWAISVDWTTPGNSGITQLASLHIADYDCTLCGMGSDWSCMPQPGTSQALDPIREPIHFPLQYRNFGDRQTLVGCFVTDVDGTDHSALRWFEFRKTGADWVVFQEGVVGGEAGVHRSVGSAAMDSSGNIAIGYTRTGNNAPYYPSIYYRGRLSTDPAGTMPYGEYVIVDATTSKTNNERWGDYSGIGVDPTDDCTFWYTTEYGGSGMTKVAAFKFDACGCLSVPAALTVGAGPNGDNKIDVTWTDSTTTSITRYFVKRSTTGAAGPYTQVAEVPDSSPGSSSGAPYTWSDTDVSGGSTYHYLVTANDGAACTSPNSTPAGATATGLCTLSPTFLGIGSVSNPAEDMCALDLSWSAATALCAGPVTYNVYRSTTSGFTPDLSNLLAPGVGGTTYHDNDQLASMTRYYYVVRAVDASNNKEETNTVEKSAYPTGPVTTADINETFEAAGGFDNPGWSHSALSGTVDWVWSTSGNPHDGTHTWYSASQTTNYHRAIVSPSFGVLANTTLSFWHTYSFESTSTCYDAGTLEISTDNGTTWTVIPDAAFTAGGFTGTVSASSNALNGKRAWCFGTIGSMVHVAVNLASFAGQTAKLRWHAGEDSSQAYTGWYIDSVVIANAGTAGPCTTGSSCANNPTSVNVTPNGPITACLGSGVTLTAAATGGSGLTYQWYDNAAIMPLETNPTLLVSATGTHSYNCKVTGDGCATSMADGSATQITWQAAPVFAGVSSVTNAQNSTCTLNVAWGAATSVCPGTITYKVYRSATTPVALIPANLLVGGLTGTSVSDSSGLLSNTTYYYVVRAVDGVGHEDANTVERTGAPTGPGGGTATLFSDNFDGAATGWTFVKGTPAARKGDFLIGDPVGTVGGSSQPLQPENDYTATGVNCLYTAENPAGIASNNDVDGGEVMAVSPAFSAAGFSTSTLTLWRWFGNETVGDSGDYFAIDVSNDGGTNWTTLETIPDTVTNANAWTQVTFNLHSFVSLTANMKVRVRVADGQTADDTVEGAIDDVVVMGYAPACSTGGTPNPKEASPAGNMSASRGAGNSVGVSFTNGCGTADHAIYWTKMTAPTITGPLAWGNAACGLGISGSASFDTGALNAGEWVYFVIVGQNATVEGSYGQNSAEVERPEATGIGACDRPQDLTGTCP